VKTEEMAKTARLRRLTRVVLALVVGLAALSPLSAADVYKARMLTGKAPVEPPTVAIVVEIQDYTTVEEVNRLWEALSKPGIDPFLTAFKDMKKGVVRILDRRGWNLTIHAAQLIPTEKGTKLQCFLIREAWNQETQMIRSEDYFMVLELYLDEKGTGDGRFYQDAGIDLLPQMGHIQMKRYGAPPKVIIQVRREKQRS
jgi:hypothetical protein